MARLFISPTIRNILELFKHCYEPKNTYFSKSLFFHFKIMETPKGFNGCIMQTDPRDWTFGNSWIKNIYEIPSQIRYEYNQLEYSRQFSAFLCTLYAPIGILSTETQTFIEATRRRTLCDLRTKMPDFDRSYGGKLVEWVNCVRRWWNAKNPDETISQYAVNIHSEEFDELIQKWHRVNIGLKGNSKYNLDISDGVLDSTNIGKTTYGHSTTIRKLNNAIFKWTYVIDNYCWEMKHNIYGFKDFQSFIDSGLVYETAYVFLKN